MVNFGDFTLQEGGRTDAEVLLHVRSGSIILTLR